MTLHGITAEKLLKAAQKKTGLDNFGDEGFTEHLRFITRTFKEDDHLNYMGKLSLLFMIKSALKRRLLLERDFDNHPEISQIPIKQPVIVVGFPRTGTTLLHSLLTQHPGCRWLRRWEVEEPFPTEPGIWGSSADPRRLRFEARIKKPPKNEFLQALNNAHPINSPEECWVLFIQTFVFNEIINMVGSYRYMKWIDDMPENTWRDAYHYYKRYLQYLSWHQPGCHWVLKYPGHMKHIGILLDLFPDAKIIQTHRDPKKFVPSSCSNTCIIQRMFLKEQYQYSGKTGEWMLPGLSKWCQKNMDQRKRLNPESFYDVHYQELVENPMEMIDKIYDYFSMERPPEMESAIKQWLAKRHGKNRPVHKYTMEQFGLTPEAIDREFQEYYKYFQLNFG